MESKVIIVIYADTIFANQIKYTFDLILSTLGIEYEILNANEINADALVISYGHKKPDIKANYHIHIYQSELFGDNYMKLESMPKLPLKRWNDLPIIYEGKGDIRDWVVRNGNIIETNIDIIASSFFMLSRYEEYLVDERDQYDRFPASASIAYKEGFLTRPIVNEYIELLWEWIDSFNLGFQRKKLWGDKDFVACLTHDVDSVKRWNLKSIFKEIIYFNKSPIIKDNTLNVLKRKGRIVKSILSCKDPHWNFKEIIELEKQYGFSSSFYFLIGGKHKSEKNYRISDAKIQRLIDNIKKTGCEVGLHGSFYSYNDIEILRKEKNILEKLVGKIFGIRQHFLRFDIRKTYLLYERIGIEYDTTLGYAQHEGFRTGFCLPFYPYNLDEERCFTTLEIPLNIMDGTFSDLKYKGVTHLETWNYIKSVLMTVKRHSGCIVILFHNSHLDSIEHYGYMQLYKKCLDWIKLNNGIGLSVKHLRDHYNLF